MSNKKDRDLQPYTTDKEFEKKRVDLKEYDYVSRKEYDKLKEKHEALKKMYDGMVVDTKTLRKRFGLMEHNQKQLNSETTKLQRQIARLNRIINMMLREDEDK